MNALVIVAVMLVVAAVVTWATLHFSADVEQPTPAADESDHPENEEEKRWHAIGLTLTGLANGLRHTRRLTRVGLVLVVLDLALSGVFAVSIVQSHRATHHAEVAAEAATAASHKAEVASRQALAATRKAETATHAALLVCEAGNTFKRGDKQLWDFLFSLFPPSPTESAADRQRIVRFKAFLAKHDALHNCTAGSG